MNLASSRESCVHSGTVLPELARETSKHYMETSPKRSKYSPNISHPIALALTLSAIVVRHWLEMV